MGQRKTRFSPRRELSIERVAQFVALAHAHEKHDHREAAAAQTVLEELGVRVEFGRPAKRKRKNTCT